MWKGKSLAQATTHTAHLGQIIRPDGTPLDQAVATVYRTPRSFTGDDTVEISVHGSLYIQQESSANSYTPDAAWLNPVNSPAAHS